MQPSSKDAFNNSDAVLTVTITVRNYMEKLIIFIQNGMRINKVSLHTSELSTSSMLYDCDTSSPCFRMPEDLEIGKIPKRTKFFSF